MSLDTSSHVNSSTSDLAESYISYLQTNDEALQWAAMEIVDLGILGPWDRLWELVQYVATREADPGTKVLASIAAGPLEDLLSNAGPDYIDRVEQLARKNPRASHMLTGVWKSNIEPAVWDRIVTWCRAVPNPLDGVYGY